MKRSLFTVVAALLLATPAVVCSAATVYCNPIPNNQSPTCPAVTASGTVLNVPNLPLTYNATFEEIPSGSPATVSVTIVGCSKGGTCSATLNTNTSTSAAVVSVNSTTVVYSYYLLTIAWTGGTNVSFQINPTLSTAPN
jgi:hypothetical protein